MSKSDLSYIVNIVNIGCIVIAIFGIIKHKKKEITIFANYTDILCTVMIFILGVILLIAFGEKTKSAGIKILTVSIFSLIWLSNWALVCIATFHYNNSPKGFFIALISKMVAIPLIVIAVIFAWSFTGSSEKQKGVDWETHRRIERNFKLMGLAMLAGIGAFIYFYLLREKEFVSLSSYLKGERFVELNSGEVRED